MSNRIITISREFGSGGHTVGKKVAERLGIPCYDNELIQKIAEQSGFVEEYIKEEGEHVPQSGWRPLLQDGTGMVRPIRICSGRFSGILFWSSRKRSPASS